MIRKSLAVMLLSALAAAMPASAQTLLFGAEASFKLPAQLSAGAGVEFRSMDWLNNTDQWSVDASLGWKPLKWLKVGVDYKFIQSQTLSAFNSDGYALPSYWNNKHRLSAGLTFSWKPVKKLSLSLRERYQLTRRPSFLVPQFNDGTPWGNKTVNGKTQHLLRSRLQAKYKPYKKCRFTPFAGVELYSRLREVNTTKHRADGARFCEKWRLSAGSEIKLDKHNELEIFYRYCDRGADDDGDSRHTIALVYSFSI